MNSKLSSKQREKNPPETYFSLFSPGGGIYTHILFIHLSVDVHWWCFYLLVTVNNAAMKIHIQASVAALF